jgi:DNA-binding transcriptional ArsR family regulator
MVVDSPADTAADELFGALGDGTRRDILRRCGDGPASISTLAEAYPMSFAAVQKHVAVLERAGLVSKRRRGRERLVLAEPDGIARARRTLDGLEAAWRGRVARMSQLLEESTSPANDETKGRDE